MLNLIYVSEQPPLFSIGYSWKVNWVFCTECGLDARLNDELGSS